jgi:hypothetical protein
VGCNWLRRGLKLAGGAGADQFIVGAEELEADLRERHPSMAANLTCSRI